MQSNETTVRLSKKTKQLLEETGKSIGQFGDTYEDIILKLIEHHRRTRVKNNGSAR